MLELISVSRVISQRKKEALPVLEQVSFGVPKGHLMAVVGATGSGKSTLLNILAGIESATGGTVLFQGQDTGKQPLHVNAIGHVPAADDTLNEMLTVRETVVSALMLRVAGLTRQQRIDKSSHLLVGVGLETAAKQRVSALSLPQRRRLKLAVALVSDPALVVCDEFTEDLDVKSEREMAALLKFVAGDHPARVVMHATRSVGNLGAYDTVVVLHEGRVCFHGPPRAVTHYFSIPTVEELYPRLAKRPAQRWGDSWMRHRDSYYDAFKLGSSGEGLTRGAEEEDGADSQRITLPKPEAKEETAEEPAARVPVPGLPSLAAQAKHLALRRWTVLRRDQKQWVGHLVLAAAPPAVASALILPNIPYVHELTRSAGALTPGTLWPAAYTCAMALLAPVLMVMGQGVRNGAREIAGERPEFERERSAGVRNGAYLLSKLGLILPLALLQSLALGLFLHVTTGGLPGDAPTRLLLLALTAVAFSTLCLGISANCRTGERAHSRGWMLVYVNVLLCGALLGLPRILGRMVQPLMTAYYGWSGSVETLQGTVVFEPMTQFVRTWFATPTVAMVGLAVHFVLGVALTMVGLRRRWR